jgi:hypothetical protein
MAMTMIMANVMCAATELAGRKDEIFSVSEINKRIEMNRMNGGYTISNWCEIEWNEFTLNYFFSYPI